MATALLADVGFESFVENEEGVDAYIPTDDFKLEAVIDSLDLLQEVEYTLSYREIAHENWNQKWEESFHPVVVDSRCAIRAPFHPAQPEVDYEIIIQPQMSFGTGHHQTTYLMTEFLLDEKDLSGQKVLDVGTGTGVLAILAEKLGAIEVLGTDIEDYIVDNALENIQHNSCMNIRVEKADLQQLRPKDRTVTLANINLNALLAEMELMAASLTTGGRLYLSGFYEQDSNTLVETASKYGLKKVEMKTRDHWTALKLIKHTG